MFGIARTTGTAPSRCFSMNAALTDAATEISSCDGLSTPFISESTCWTVCGLTARIIMSADSAAIGFDSVPAPRTALACGRAEAGGPP